MSIEIIPDETFIKNNDFHHSANGSDNIIAGIKIHSNEAYIVNRRSKTGVTLEFSRGNVDGKTNIDVESNASSTESAKKIASIANEIYQLFLLENIELGCDSKTSALINKLITNNGYEIVDVALTQLLSEHILYSTKPIIICKFLTVLSELDSSLIPVTSSYAITSLSHKKYDSVKEMVLMTIELWRNNDALVLLEEMEPYRRKHLEQYRLKIIGMLKGV